MTNCFLLGKFNNLLIKIVRHLKLCESNINMNIKIEEIIKDGIEKLEIEAYNSALLAFNKVLVIDKSNYLAYYYKAICCVNLNKIDEAMENIEISLELNSNFAEAYNERANILQHFDDFGEALFDYSRAININPNYYEAYYNRGYVNFKLERYKEAKEDFKKVLSKNPYDSDVYNNLGLCYFNLNKPIKAISLLMKALELYPEHEARENLILIHESMEAEKNKKP